MKLIADLGITQLVLPPHPRPHMDSLRRLGFSGTDEEIISYAYKYFPDVLLQCSSSSFMWTANSATVAPSSDSEDKKVHITPANLASYLHRKIEVDYTQEMLRKVFANDRYFVHHSPIPSTMQLLDEGSANHIRFSSGKKGLHLFVYGKKDAAKSQAPKRFPARQTLEACQALKHLHKLSDEMCVLAQQNPKAIDSGVFHNDVISTGHEDLFFYHEDAFVHTDRVVQELQKKAMRLFGKKLRCMRISRKDLSLEDAVRSYFFNSQIVTSHGKIIWIAPEECLHIPKAKKLVEKLEGVDKVLYISLSESMKNGGGPACLRMRLMLTQRELQSIHQGVILNDALYTKLKRVIETYYPERFYLQDLLDPKKVRDFHTTHKQVIRLLQL